MGYEWAHFKIVSSSTASNTDWGAEYVENISSRSLKKISRQRNWHNKKLSNFEKFENAKSDQNTDFAKFPSA